MNKSLSATRFRYLNGASALVCIMLGVIILQVRMQRESLSHDFGLVSQNSNLTHTFVWRNFSMHELRLSGTSSSCSCTVSAPKQNVVKPFGILEIPVTIGTENYVGTKFSTVVLSFINSDPVTLRIGCEVVEEFPAFVNLGNIEPNSTKCTKIVPHPIEGKPFLVTGLAFPNDLVDLNISRPNESKQVIEFCSKVSVPSGPFTTDLVLLTEGEGPKSRQIRVVGNVLLDVTVSPKNVNLGLMRLGEEKTVEFEFRSRNDQEFSVISVVSDDLIKNYVIKNEGNRSTLTCTWLLNSPQRSYLGKIFVDCYVPITKSSIRIQIPYSGYRRD